jgi:hypothetical protein
MMRRASRRAEGETVSGTALPVGASERIAVPRHRCFTQLPAGFIQKATAGTREVFPSRGQLPVGVTTDPSAVSERFRVSSNKTRIVSTPEQARNDEVRPS